MFIKRTRAFNRDIAVKGGEPRLASRASAAPVSSFPKLSPGDVQLLFFVREDRDLVRGEGLAPRSPERNAPDEAGANQSGAVGGEGQKRVASRSSPPAGGTVLDPKQGTWQVRETGREAFPDDLGRQSLDHLVAPILGQLATQDHGGVAEGCARVDLYPAPPHPVAVTPALVNIVVQRLHYCSAPPGACLGHWPRLYQLTLRATI